MRFSFSVDVQPGELVEFLQKLDDGEASPIKTSIENVGETVAAILKNEEGESHAITD